MQPEYFWSYCKIIYLNKICIVKASFESGDLKKKVCACIIDKNIGHRGLDKEI